MIQVLKSVKPKIEHTDARPLNIYSREYGIRPTISKMSTKEESILRSIKADPIYGQSPFYASIKGGNFEANL